MHSRRSISFAVILSFLLLVTGCTSGPSGKPGVPVIGGMRWESPEDSLFLAENLEAFRAQGIHSVMITFPMEADTAGTFLPAWPLAARGLQNTARLLHEEGFTLQIALTQRNQVQIFPAGKISDPPAWFRKLTSISDSMIALSGAERLVVGTDLLSAESFPDEWCKWATTLQQKYHIPVSYAVSVERLRGISFTHCSSEVAVSWSAPEDGNVVAYCRDWNYLTGKVADSFSKPVFIFSPNLLGQDKDLQFRMRLRFWPDDVAVSGFHLNTLYGKSVLVDSTSYFGLAGETAFLKTLGEYVGTADFQK
jgi:hypothetical protein